MNVQDERNLHLRARLKDEHLLSDAVAAQLEVPWRSNSILGQIGFFFLTVIALAAFYGFLYLLGVAGKGLITGVAAIVLAEYLMGAHRWGFTGVESALWLGGIFSLLSELPSSGTPESNLVLAAAAAIAGVRVRNPLFGALSAVFVMIYFEERFDLGVICALLIALASCIALLRKWHRPTTEAVWIALALIMPIAGRFTADKLWFDATITLYAILAVIALTLAISGRHHAIFLCAMSSFAVAAFDLSEKLPVPLEGKLALGGVLLLTIAFVLSRALRNHTRGFVLTPTSLTPLDDAIIVTATLSAQPSTPEPAQQPAAAGGGGNFGGAGASGDY